jgi:threonine dehydratase
MNAPLTHLPTAADVADAAKLIESAAVRTPLVYASVLESTGAARVFLKPEIFQRTGSFKFRGAYNTIARIPPENRAAGVVAFSSGNHAQGVAAAAKLMGMKATIVMPADAPLIKRENTKNLGAEVVLYDRDKEDREEIGRRICGERGATLVPPYDHPHVIAGQGTIGFEICDDLQKLGLAPDIVLSPASGGGLIAGVSLAVKERCPQARVIAVEPEGFDDTGRSLKSGKREKNTRMSGSICDALLTAEPGVITFEINRRLLDGAVTVSDDEVRKTIAFAARKLGLKVEPGGIVALAALLFGKADVKGKNVVLVLSGGNIDPAIYAQALGE